MNEYQVLDYETAKVISRKECPYCQDHLRVAKKLKVGVIWNPKSRDIVGVTLDSANHKDQKWQKNYAKIIGVKPNI